MSNVVVIKLVSGLELVGTESAVQPPMVFQLDQAFQITFENVGGKSFRQGLAPLTMSTADPEKGHGVIVSAIQVIGVYDPSKALLDSYARITSTIITPSSNIVEMPKLTAIDPPSTEPS